MKKIYVIEFRYGKYTGVRRHSASSGAEAIAEMWHYLDMVYTQPNATKTARVIRTVEMPNP